VNLLCCRAKIDVAARGSQIAKHDADSKPCQPQRMASLEEQLRTLPQRGLHLARCERDIATHRLTLNTNAFHAAQAAKALLREGNHLLLLVLL